MQLCGLKIISPIVKIQLLLFLMLENFLMLHVIKSFITTTKSFIITKETTILSKKLESKIEIVNKKSMTVNK